MDSTENNLRISLARKGYRLERKGEVYRVMRGKTLVFADHSLKYVIAWDEAKTTRD